MAAPLIVIAGPTGTGKSSLALDLAESFGGEIVNCDSLQLYRGFDVGTAKTPESARRGVPHHLFDVIGDARVAFSAGDYARLARAVVAEITGRGRVPIVVGGTGFYLKALLEGLPELPGRDEALRVRLAKRETRRAGSLHRVLRRLDPAAAGRIHERDVQKVTRALEIRVLTGGALPRPDRATALTGYAVVKIGLDPDRALLFERIDARVVAMFEGGLVEEVRELLGRGATGDEKPFESLGYKQTIQYVRGEISREQAVESTQTETRQYAKRQWTWLRRDKEVHWVAGFGDEVGVVERAKAFCRAAF